MTPTFPLPYLHPPPRKLPLDIPGLCFYDHIFFLQTFISIQILKSSKPLIILCTWVPFRYDKLSIPCRKHSFRDYFYSEICKFVPPTEDFAANPLFRISHGQLRSSNQQSLISRSSRKDKHFIPSSPTHHGVHCNRNP